MLHKKHALKCWRQVHVCIKMTSVEYSSNTAVARFDSKWCLFPCLLKGKHWSGCIQVTVGTCDCCFISKVYVIIPESWTIRLLPRSHLSQNLVNQKRLFHNPRTRNRFDTNCFPVRDSCSGELIIAYGPKKNRKKLTRHKVEQTIYSFVRVSRNHFQLPPSSMGRSPHKRRRYSDNSSWVKTRKKFAC